MPKGRLRINRGQIILSINPPIETTHYNNKNKEDLMELVRSTMKRDLEKIAEGSKLKAQS